MNKEKLLEIITENLKMCDKYIIIKDELGNIIYPEDKDSIERFIDEKQIEFYDKKTSTHYIKKTSIFYIEGEAYLFELIENNNKYKKIEEKVKYDLPTKLLNKETIMNTIDNSILNTSKKYKSLAVTVCDIDYFKNINDTYSHLAGDKILERVAEIFKEYENENCQIGRFGGDEFVFIFKNKESDEVFEIISNIKKRVQNMSVVFEEKTIKDITMSFGICSIDSYDNFEFKNLQQIVDERKKIFCCADEALYESKRNGKNRITIVNKKI